MSEHTIVGHVEADADGNLSAKVKIPADAQRGVHFFFVQNSESGQVASTPTAFLVTGADGKVTLRGRMSDEGVECKAMRGDLDELYTLTGSADWPAAGTQVTVVGTIAEMSICQQGVTIAVESSRQRDDRDPMKTRLSAVIAVALALALTASVAPLSAQTFPTNDRVIRNMWTQGMGPGSQAERLAQAPDRLDRSAPHRHRRLTPTRRLGPEAVCRLGHPARREQYGTWKAGAAAPRASSSPRPAPTSCRRHCSRTARAPKDPSRGTSSYFPSSPIRGVSAVARRSPRKVHRPGAAQITCRPFDNLSTYARAGTVESILERQDSISRSWSHRYATAGANLIARIDASGAAALLTSFWSEGWGVNKIQGTDNKRVPMLDVSCEDNGLLVRLAERGQGPRLRLDARAEFTGEQPTFNVVAELKGRQLPNEYVLLSAHLDSWDAAAGATDNGTGTIMMMEAMRILKATYPNPKRTILVGHWGSEEQGVNGSAAFAEDHPDIGEGIQFGFNQDNGTWRIEAIRMQAFDYAEPQVKRWLDRLPPEIGNVPFTSPDFEGGSDHFVVHLPGSAGRSAPSQLPGLSAIHVAHQSRHVRQDHHRRSEEQRDARRDARVSGVEDPERLSRRRDRLPPDSRGVVPERAVCGVPLRHAP
jgi:hypothetical protein